MNGIAWLLLAFAAVCAAAGAWIAGISPWLTQRRQCTLPPRTTCPNCGTVKHRSCQDVPLPHYEGDDNE